MNNSIVRRLGLAASLAAFALTTTPALAVDQGDWLVRLRGIGVMPTSDSGGISPDLTGGSLEAQRAYVPELDITYMATENLGLELILATSPHDIDGQGAVAGLGKAADTWLLPPTLLLQWHFLPKGKVRPYVGAGINYTITYGENATASLENALGGPTTVDLGNSLGWAVQAGVDIDVAENWFVNVDVKYIDINVDAEFRTGGTTRTADVGIDPVVFGIGVGYRF
ncbi:MAG: OmpW family outer membrane protein [Thalassobaculum sp.]|uniref:OmpW/AlkL family protein n=1 Tax=Thalassobaculum sp. TaxID=2022740 RepID=UPI0032EBA683